MEMFVVPWGLVQSWQLGPLAPNRNDPPLPEAYDQGGPWHAPWSGGCPWEVLILRPRVQQRLCWQKWQWTQTSGWEPCLFLQPWRCLFAPVQPSPVPESETPAP